MIALAVEGSAARILVALSDVPDEVWELTQAVLPEAQLRLVAEGDCFFVLGPAASPSSSLTIFPLTPQGYFHGVPDNVRTTVLERCLRAAMILERPGQTLPRSWAPYNHENFTIFYSTTIAMGVLGRSAQSILQKHPGGTPHMLVASFLPVARAEDLHCYALPAEAENAFLQAATRYADALVSLPQAVDGHLFGRLAASALPFGARGLTEWKSLLTPAQAAFLSTEIVGPTKIRGAAGTGKTLALMLKAVHDLYRAVDEKRGWRSLLLTHNWSSAETIRSALATIDERGLLREADRARCLEVMTLQTLATSALPIKNTPDVLPISEDGHDGKMMQLEMIDSLVEDLRKADWAVFRTGCSREFRERVEAPRGSADSRLLSWDLLNEFACVISASRNTTRDDYLGQERRPWMMHLGRGADREVVYLLHERFRSLMHEGLNALTTYDVINDYLRLLDTNAWHLLRRKDGYDTLLVDEFHLFNKQEILVFQYLSRDPSKTPPAVLALDPRQSPVESFLGFKADKRHPAARVFAGDNIKEVRFDQVFRYTAEINALLNVLEQCWFGFEPKLEDEHNALPRVTTSTGPRPSLMRVPDLSRALDEALRTAREALSGAQRSASAAVLCLAPSTFEALVRRIAALGREHECRLVDSRDSSEALSTIGRRYVVSQPEYVAGAQFDLVVVVDANESQAKAGADDLLRLRRVLSGLYLAISRAKKDVRLVAADAEGGPLRFLRPAIDSHHLEDSRA